MGEVFGGLGGGDFLQSAAVALFWWVEVGTTRGSRPVDYDPAKGVTIKPYQAKGGIVGNDPCVVPVREMLLANLFLCERRLIPPHQSPTAPASPQGEAFSKYLSFSMTM